MTSLCLLAWQGINEPLMPRAEIPNRRPGDYQFYAHRLDGHPDETMKRKLKNLNGSPGRVLAADIVINGSPNILVYP